MCREGGAVWGRGSAGEVRVERRRAQQCQAFQACSGSDSSQKFFPPSRAASQCRFSRTVSRAQSERPPPERPLQR